ncbi:MAG: VOC family protein [Pseudomonadota bacterium]
MRRAIAAVTLLVPDIDAALAFFVGVLEFELVEDSVLPSGRRWIRVGPNGDDSACLRLAHAVSAEERRAVGHQAAGRVFLFLTTDDLGRDYRRLRAAGVRFTEPPRSEAYGEVAVFVDPFGNRWDLIQPKTGAVPVIPA